VGAAVTGTLVARTGENELGTPGAVGPTLTVGDLTSATTAAATRSLVSASETSEDEAADEDKDGQPEH
jgi:hypothetical protein